MASMPSEPFIPVSRPSLGPEEEEAAARVIRSGWVTQGPEVAAFEREFAAAVGATYACAVSSGTTALHLALLVAGVEPGHEVITVSHSFIATASCITYAGALPVFVDVLEDTHNIDPGAVEAAITPRTRAILCVHQVGMPCDLVRLIAIARRHHVILIEDAACALGSEVRRGDAWERIGRPHGDIACFSFHPRKILTTGDGGMLTTENAEWDRRCRLLRHHGMSLSDVTRHETRKVVFETYDTVGYNYRLTDIQAAIGRVQLARLPALIARRRRLADCYRQLLAQVPGVRVPGEPDWAHTNWQSYCVGLPEGCRQATVMQRLLDRGIAVRRGVMCSHREPAFAAPAGQSPAPAFRVHGTLARSEAAQDHSIILPLFDQLTEPDQHRIVDGLREACVPE